MVPWLATLSWPCLSGQRASPLQQRLSLPSVVGLQCALKAPLGLPVRAALRRPAAAAAAAPRRVVLVGAAAPAVGMPACPPKVGHLSDEERKELAEQFGFRSIGKGALLGW